MQRTLTLLVLGMAAAAGFSSAPAAAATRVDSSVSVNWSGYAVSGTSFSAVSGSWVQPSASCTAGSPGYSAFWVGLGGFDTSSQALEQIGNLGTIAFTSCAATAAGHTGTIADTTWSATAIELRSRALSADGSSFGVAWQPGAAAPTWPRRSRF